MLDDLRFTPHETLSRSDRGATAIEYAIIAGLIGLGIVGSLVTTKNSLNSVLGTTSSQMGSAVTMGESGVSPAASAMAAFSGRTPATSAITKDASNPKYPKNTYLYNYPDGSYAKREITYYSSGSIASQNYSFYDKATNSMSYVNYDGSGSQTYFERDQLEVSGKIVSFDYQQGPGQNQISVVTGIGKSISHDPITQEFSVWSDAGIRDAMYLATLVKNPTL